MYHSIMKKLLKVLLLSFFVFSVMACGSTPVSTESESVIAAPEQETAAEEVETPKVEEVDEEEYVRSTRQISNGDKIPKDQFVKDKAEILKIIKELEVVMANQDYENWLKYISTDSKDFYSNPRKINNKGKIEVLNGLEDYFIDLFIPSRAKATINEIRYISSESVKAVEFTKPKKANERPKITTYYNFVKENGKWCVELPTNIVVK